jgi:hypothetical protein
MSRPAYSGTKKALAPEEEEDARYEALGSSSACRVGRNLELYQARGGTAGLIFRGLPFRNKADAR